MYFLIKNSVFSGFYTEEQIDSITGDLYEITEQEVSNFINLANNHGHLIVYKNNILITINAGNPDKKYINPIYDLNKEIWIDLATQEEFIQAKKQTENQMSKLNIDMKSRLELKLSINDQTLEMEELRSKLNYIESNILVKI